jgi:hypothetical protein
MNAGAAPLREDEAILTHACWGMTVATGFVLVVGAAQSGFTLDWRSAAPGLVGCLALGSLVCFYRFRWAEERIAVSLSCVIQLIAFTSVAAPLSYLSASAGKPLWDPTLYAWDRALGLDWQAYLAFVNERPWLGTAFNLAYRSILPQTVIAAVALGLTGRIRECRAFVAAFMISGLVSIAVSGAMPAMAMFVYLGIHPHDYPNLDPAAAFVHVSHLNALRDGTMRMISLDGAEGLITFPSYHAALGVIFARALWAVPYLRWPALGVNALMVAGTPIDGGHYFVDVIGGMLIALLSIAAVRALSLVRVMSVPPQENASVPVRS